VNGNNFVGDAWKIIPSWPEIEIFRIQYNYDMDGTIPTEIGLLTHLRTFARHRFSCLCLLGAEDIDR